MLNVELPTWGPDLPLFWSPSLGPKGVKACIMYLSQERTNFCHHHRRRHSFDYYCPQTMDRSCSSSTWNGIHPPNYRRVVSLPSLWTNKYVGPKGAKAYMYVPGMSQERTNLCHHRRRHLIVTHFALRQCIYRTHMFQSDKNRMSSNTAVAVVVSLLSLWTDKSIASELPLHPVPFWDLTDETGREINGDERTSKGPRKRHNPLVIRKSLRLGQIIDPHSSLSTSLKAALFPMLYAYLVPRWQYTGWSSSCCLVGTRTICMIYCNTRIPGLICTMQILHDLSQRQAGN